MVPVRNGVVERRSRREASNPSAKLALSREAAARVIQQLAHAPDRLLDYPRIGEKLEAYEPREVRRIIVGNYEVRYEIAAGIIFILRLWHCRENRSFESEE
jgi:plasmid stabilization system protein ParE